MANEMVVLQGKPFSVELQSMLGSTNYGWCLTGLPQGIALMMTETIPTARGVAPVIQRFWFGAISATVEKAEIEFTLMRISDASVTKQKHSVLVTVVSSDSEDFAKFNENCDPAVNAVCNAAMPYGFPYAAQDVTVKYGYPSGLRDAALIYGFPVASRDVAFKYGYPCGIQDVTLKYGYPCGAQDAAQGSDNFCGTQNIAHKYGYPCGIQDATLKYGYPCGAQDAAQGSDDSCGTQNIAHKYGYPCGVQDAAVKYGFVSNPQMPPMLKYGFYCDSTKNV